MSYTTHDADPHATARQAVDPVCGMSVDPATARYKAEHAWTTYHFCSGQCRDKFTAEPKRYLAPNAEAKPAKPAPAGTVYTCPMHPQIRQDHPGNCPICGMARRVMSTSSGLRPVSAVATSGSSAMPQIGQFPGWS